MWTKHVDIRLFALVDPVFSGKRLILGESYQMNCAVFRIAGLHILQGIIGKRRYYNVGLAETGLFDRRIKQVGIFL